MLTYDALVKEIIEKKEIVKAIKIRYEAPVAKIGEDKTMVDEDTLPIDINVIRRYFIVDIPAKTDQFEIIQTVDYTLNFIREELDRFYKTKCPRDVSYFHFTMIKE